MQKFKIPSDFFFRSSEFFCESCSCDFYREACGSTGAIPVLPLLVYFTIDKIDLHDLVFLNFI